MYNRLKSLELQGYKTFANRTLFEFAGTVTAIVGPNGSGKSNIADSLRWVLGEQSYSLLRGKKTEDMIFSGSEFRPRAGMAAATVTFNNEENWLPIDFSEVTITRRAYRDGANEYLINGQRVRLKDVSELLAQSGLAERTYTIIGQGLVDAALALKAEDRRKLFEEAAGIGLYRTRREEAVRRLETTLRNLERVEDILVELEPRLRSLERQAKRAQEYEQVKLDLQVLLRDWYGYHWRRAQQELLEAREADQVQELALNKARAEQGKLDTQLTELRQHIQADRQVLNDKLRQSNELNSRRETIQRDLAVADERVRLMNQQAQTVGDEIVRLDGETELQAELIGAVEKEITRLDAELKDGRARQEQARKALSTVQEERKQLESRIQSTRQQVGSLNARQGQIEARLVERSAQMERDQNSLEVASQALQRSEKDEQAANQRQQSEQAKTQETDRIQNSLAEEVKTLNRKLSERDLSRKDFVDELMANTTEAERLKARLEVLIQAEAALSGYAEGTRHLLQAIRKGQISGKPGALNQSIETPPGLERAISAALGDFLEAVPLDEGKPANIEAAFSLLDGEIGRGSILPLPWVKPVRPVTPAELGLSFSVDADSGWIGIASEQVRTTDDLRALLEVLLAGVWLVKDRQAARAIIESIPPDHPPQAELAHLRIVTLRGEIFYLHGPAIAGVSNRDKNSETLLRRQRERKELEEARAAANEHQATIKLHLAQFDQDSATLRTQAEARAHEQRSARQNYEKASLALQQSRLAVEQAGRQVRWQAEQRQRLQEQIQQAEAESGRLRSEQGDLDAKLTQARDQLRQLQSALAELVLDEFQAQVAHWNTRIAVAERALNDEHRRLDERKQASEKSIGLRRDLQTRLESLVDGVAAIQTEKITSSEEELRISQKIDELLKQIEPGEANLRLLETELTHLEEAETIARQAVSLADHRHAQTRIVFARRQETLQSLQRRIEEDFGLVAFDYEEQVSGQAPLPLEGMVEQLPRIVQLPADIEEAIKRQRAQLRRIGPINPEAQAEYKAVKERFNFMTEQIADLRHAEVDIREVIHELDELMQRDFRKTFDAVAAEFKLIFQRLFGGGSARLVLTNPDNLTDTGIDIEARLPGRRTQGLSLLSGGERSLTATSLVFALLKIAPTPFCVLDEVDAMLDEANVGRFRDLLSELSQQTQFVIVTHNRNTVQAAGVIYGVTMGRDSASQVVSLKMDQVEQVFE